MGALKAIIAVVSLAIAVPAQAETVTTWRPYIVEASSRFGVPLAWIEAVMRAESGGRTQRGGRPTRSRAGAIGLMQLMPGTWAEIRWRLGLGDDPDAPRDNILAGTFYLRLMYDRFGYPGLFAAYNAGPARYAEHLAGRRALPAETSAYLASVAPSAGQPTPVVAKPMPPVSIFAVRKDVRSRSETGRDEPAPSLFVALSKGEKP